MENLQAIGIVARASQKWDDQYKVRQVIERTFRSLKHSRGLEGHVVRGLAKISLLISASLWAYAATMLARAMSGDMANLRKMRIKLA